MPQYFWPLSVPSMTPTSPCHSRAMAAWKGFSSASLLLKTSSMWPAPAAFYNQGQTLPACQSSCSLCLRSSHRTQAQSHSWVTAWVTSWFKPDWSSSLKAVDGLASEGLAWAGLKQGGQQQFRHVWWTLAGSGREDIGCLDYAIHFHADSRPTNLLQSLEAKDTTRQRFQLNTVEKLCS